MDKGLSKEKIAEIVEKAVSLLTGMEHIIRMSKNAGVNLALKEARSTEKIII